MQHLCGFVIESIKRQRNCSISGKIDLLPIRTIKQAKKRKIRDRKNQGRGQVYPLKTAYF